MVGLCASRHKKAFAPAGNRWRAYRLFFRAWLHYSAYVTAAGCDLEMFPFLWIGAHMTDTRFTARQFLPAATAEMAVVHAIGSAWR